MLPTVVAVALAATALVFGLGSAAHALLHKSDPRSQLGWLVVCVLVPVVGAIGYWSFGVNRIRTRARKWHKLGLFVLAREMVFYKNAGVKLKDEHPVMADNMQSLLHISRRVTGRPLLPGNQVVPLYNGDEAFPSMLAAINSAENYVYLCSYLFDTDATGREFIDALGRAAARGVDVRVLIDAIGERYDRPRAGKLLSQHVGVKVARYLPLRISLSGLRINMRNHRKVLVVDGTVGFTGGMNISGRHRVTDTNNRNPTADIHFEVRGPAVYVLEEVFFEDWFFTTGDKDWNEPAQIARVGPALCRGIKDGPNEDMGKLPWILVGAIGCARERVRIMTPYFIPSPEINAALIAAALRGTLVELILPARSNLPFVDWASRAMLRETMEHGVHVYLQPQPFDHSKLLVVDDCYTNLGSANLDPRSLRLNFEFNLEVFDPALAAALARHVDTIKARSKELTLQTLDGTPLWQRLRNASAKLFAPYL